MANYVQEGMRSATTSHRNVCNDETIESEWLRSTNLPHLIPIFKQNNLTLQELMTMEEQTLSQVLMLLNINKLNTLRLVNNIKNLKASQKKQQRPNRIIITKEETVALRELDNTLKDLSNQTKSIEQQNALNESFREILRKVQKRQHILLKEMKSKRDEYKNILSQQLQNISKTINYLTIAKNQCEYNINNRRDLLSANDDNVQLIDSILSQIDIKNTNFNCIQQQICFEHTKSESLESIKCYGSIKMTDTNIDLKNNNSGNMILDIVTNEEIQQQQQKNNNPLPPPQQQQPPHIISNLSQQQMMQLQQKGYSIQHNPNRPGSYIVMPPMVQQPQGN